MIIPRHRKCDFCGQIVGVNKRYYKINSKNYIHKAYDGDYHDNRTHDICEDCMNKFCRWMRGGRQ